MKKLFTFTIAILFMVNTAQAFVIEEHCNDSRTFEVSNLDACEEICPNRSGFDESGSHSTIFVCKQKNNPNYAFDAFLEEHDYFCRSKTPLERIDCIKKSIEEGNEFVYLDINEKHLCSEERGYILADDDSICTKKCPSDKPLMGYVGDCYSCDTVYPIMIRDYSQYAVSDSEIKNVCPNRVIISGISYKNPIKSINTIEKLEKIIKDKEYYPSEKYWSEYGPHSLLDWNLMLNHDPKVIMYLLENDPENLNSQVFYNAINSKPPESIMKMLLDRAQKDWFIVDNIPLSSYAKQTGASESVQKLIKSYEKKFGIDYEPKLWKDNNAE